MRYRWEITEYLVSESDDERAWYLFARPLNGGLRTSTRVSRRRLKESVGGLPARPYRVSFEGYNDICRARFAFLRGLDVKRRAWSVAKHD